MMSELRSVIGIVCTLTAVAALGACDSEDAATSPGGPDGAVEDAAPSPDLPDGQIGREVAFEPGSDECKAALKEEWVPYDEAGCWSLAEPAGDNQCAGFYCNWSPDQIDCQVKESAICKEVDARRLGCDSTMQNTVAACARTVQARLFLAGGDFVEDTIACAADEIDVKIEDDCMRCYVESANCARNECLGECLAGDTKECDACREVNGCTPDFHECIGFPDPQRRNPDGTKRD